MRRWWETHLAVNGILGEVWMKFGLTVLFVCSLTGIVVDVIRE